MKHEKFLLGLVLCLCAFSSQVAAQSVSCQQGTLVRSGKFLTPAQAKTLIKNSQGTVKKLNNSKKGAAKAKLGKIDKKIKSLKALIRALQALMKTCLPPEVEPTPGNGSDPLDDIRIVKRSLNGHSLVIFEDIRKYNSDWSPRQILHMRAVDNDGIAVLQINDSSAPNSSALGFSRNFIWKNQKLSQICAPDLCDRATYVYSNVLSGKMVIATSKTPVEVVGAERSLWVWNGTKALPLENYQRPELDLFSFAVTSQGEAIELTSETGKLRRWSSETGKRLPDFDLNVAALPAVIQLENEQLQRGGITGNGRRSIEFDRIKVAEDGSYLLGVDVTSYYNSGSDENRTTVNGVLQIVSGTASYIVGTGSGIEGRDNFLKFFETEAAGPNGAAALSLDNETGYIVKKGNIAREIQFDSNFENYRGINSRGEAVSLKHAVEIEPLTNWVAAIDLGSGPQSIRSFLGNPADLFFVDISDINECGAFAGDVNYTDNPVEFEKAFVATPNRCRQ